MLKLTRVRILGDNLANPSIVIQVVDQDGKPVVGAGVNILFRDSARYAISSVEVAYTDEAGKIQIDYSKFPPDAAYVDLYLRDASVVTGTGTFQLSKFGNSTFQITRYDRSAPIIPGASWLNPVLAITTVAAVGTLAYYWLSGKVKVIRALTVPK